MVAHVERKQRERQGHGDFEPPGKVDQLWVVGDLRRHPHGLERHAADRAMARAFLHDLRMHRAGVERALGQRLRLVLLGEIVLRLGRKLPAAAFRAEIIVVAGMLRARAARAESTFIPHTGSVAILASLSVISAVSWCIAGGLFLGGNSIV